MLGRGFRTKLHQFAVNIPGPVKSNKIKSIAVIGERCSGSFFVQALLRQNFRSLFSHEIPQCVTHQTTPHHAASNTYRRHQNTFHTIPHDTTPRHITLYTTPHYTTADHSTPKISHTTFHIRSHTTSHIPPHHIDYTTADHNT